MFNTSCMVIIQCLTHSAIIHYLAVVSWLGIIHIPIGLTLIIVISGWSQLDIGRLEKHGFEYNWTCIIRLESYNSYCALSHILCICQHFLCSLLFVHIPILIHRQQLIGVTVQPHTNLPKLKWRANTQWPACVVLGMMAIVLILLILVDYFLRQRSLTTHRSGHLIDFINVRFIITRVSQ